MFGSFPGGPGLDTTKSTGRKEPTPLWNQQIRSALPLLEFQPANSTRRVACDENKKSIPSLCPGVWRRRAKRRLLLYIHVDCFAPPSLVQNLVLSRPNRRYTVGDYTLVLARQMGVRPAFEAQPSHFPRRRFPRLLKSSLIGALAHRRSPDAIAESGGHVYVSGWSKPESDHP